MNADADPTRFLEVVEGFFAGIDDAAPGPRERLNDSLSLISPLSGAS